MLADDRDRVEQGPIAKALRDLKRAVLGACEGPILITDADIIRAVKSALEFEGTNTSS